MADSLHAIEQIMKQLTASPDSLPMFKYHLDAPMITAKPASASSATLKSFGARSSGPKSAAAPPNPKKVFLLDRSRYYSFAMEKMVDSGEQAADSSEEHERKNMFYARLRLGIADEKLRKIEQELIKAWSLHHRGERLIELRPEGGEAEVEAEAEQASKPKAKGKPKGRKNASRSRSKSNKQCNNCLKRQASEYKFEEVHATLVQEQQGTQSAPPSEPSWSDKIARTLEHDAYLNQCIVFLDFSGQADKKTNSVEQIISFRVNCVSSQFPEKYRSQLAIILETFAYEKSDSGAHRRVDTVHFPVSLSWPGGAEHRTKSEQLAVLKDAQLEALHDSIHSGPHRLPKCYRDCVPGKGYFAFILEAATTYGRLDTEPSLTYLDRGVPFILRLKNLNFIPSSQSVNLRTSISIGLKCPTEKEQFTDWELMNCATAGPMLEMDFPKSVLPSDRPLAVLDIVRASSNMLTVNWRVWERTEEEVRLALKVNCLSAQFITESAAYRHGQPLWLTVDTFDDSFEGASRKIDSSSCLVVVLEKGQSARLLRSDFERFCANAETAEKAQAVGEKSQETQDKGVSVSKLQIKTEVSGPAESQPPPTRLQPSYSNTLLRTSPEFVVKLLLFLAVEAQNDYHPFFLHSLEMAHFRESLMTFMRKRLPPTVERLPLSDIFILGLPEMSTNNKQSHLGVVLTNEMIAKLTNKSLFKCLLFKDTHTKVGETDLQLVFQPAPN